jgi:outer membrane PBP1 activator LpoA protein
MDEDGKRQLEDAAQALHGAERELIAAMQNFVDAQAKAGKSRSRGRALDILRQLVQKAREEKAKQRRAAFKIIE